MTEGLIVGVAILASGLVQGATGFGFVVVAVPSLALIFDVKQAVVLGQLLAIFACAALWISHARRVDGPRLRRWLIWSAIGMPFGVILFRTVGDRTLRVTVGAVVGVLALAILAGRFVRVARSDTSDSVAGLIGGVLATSTGMSGPPLAIYAATQTDERDVYRASMSAYGCIASMMSVAMLFGSGAAPVQDVPRFFFLYVFVLFLGQQAGSRLFRVMSARHYQIAIVGVLLVLSISALVSSTGGR